MKVTLRKAHRLDKALQDLAKKPVKTTARVMSYGDITVEITQLVDQHRSDSEDRLTALNAAFTIRELLAVANADTGINTLLTQDAKLVAEQSFLQGLTQTTSYRRDTVVSTDDAHAAFSANAMRSLSDARLAADHIDMTALTATRLAEIDDRIADIKRERSIISDSLLEASSSNHVILPSHVVEYLVEKKIL